MEESGVFDMWLWTTKGGDVNRGRASAATTVTDTYKGGKEVENIRQR